MLKKVLWYLRHLYSLPWSPRGRRLRIERLMVETGEGRDVCAAIIYGRDSMRGIELSDEEGRDALRIRRLLEQGKITLPADKTAATKRVVKR